MTGELERLRPFHLRVAALVSLQFGGNGLDAGVVSFSLPGVRAEWGLLPSDLGLILPATGTGQLVGAIAVGALADRIGRRLAFGLAGFLSAGALGLAGLAPSPVALASLLFISGLGFGGVAPVASALISEFSPPAYRGRLLAWTQVIWVIGWNVAGIGGGWFAEVLGWRGILGLGALPILVAFASMLLVPESPRFLSSRGRHDEAVALAELLAHKYGIVVPIGAPVRTGPSAPAVGHLIELWRAPLRRRTFVLWTTWFGMNAAYAGPVVWLTVLLAEAGAESALRLSALVGFSMIPATLVSVLLIDRIGRRALLVCALGTAAAGSTVITFAGSPAMIVVGAIGVASGILAAWPPVLAWAGELYPTRMRATAAGWASGIARLGSISAPLLFGALLGSTGDARSFAVLPFAVVLAAAVVGVAILSEETKGRTLEELSR